MRVVVLLLIGAPDECVEPYFYGSVVQTVATHKSATRFGEESFALIAECGIQVVRDDRTEYCIAKELESLVVLQLLVVSRCAGTVSEGCLIGMQMPWYET